MRLPSFFRFKEPDAGRLAVGNYNLTAQLPNGRTIQFAGYMYTDDTAADVDGRLDAIMDRMDRVRARCEIPELEAAREQKIKALSQYREVLAELEKRQRDGDKLSSADLMTIKNLRVNLEQANKDIEKGAEAIAEAKAKAGVR